MKKTTIISVILLLAVLFSGSAMAGANDVTVAGPPAQITNVLPDNNKNVEISFTITNILDNDLGALAISIDGEFKNQENNKVINGLTIAPLNIDALGAHVTRTLTVTIPILKSQDKGDYSGAKIVIKNGVETIGSGNIELKVQGFKELTVNPTTLSISGQSGQAAIYSEEITLQNTGNEQLQITPEVVFGLEKNFLTIDNEKVSFSFEEKAGENWNAANLVIGPATTKVVRVKADANQISTDYAKVSGGKINFVDPQYTKSAELSVKFGDQGICKLGPKNSGKVILDSGSDIDDQIDNDYRIGETIKLSFDVKNKLGQDIDADIEVEAVLYNIDTDKVISSDSDSKNIDYNEEETFEFELELTPKDIKGDDNIVLLIKAYADESDYTEDNYCSEDSYTINVEQDDVDLRIEEFQILPSSAAAGEQVEIVATVLNYGKDKTANVRLKVKNAELKLDVESERYTLEEYTNKDNDDEQRIRLLITIPTDAKAKDYELQVYAISPDGESTMEIVKLTVEGEVEEEVPAEKPAVQPAKTTVTKTTEVPAITGAAVGTFTDKSIFDSIKRTSDLPLLFWIILDLVLVFVIVTVILLVARKRK